MLQHSIRKICTFTNLAILYGAVDVQNTFAMQDGTLYYHEYREFEYIGHYKANMLLRATFLSIQQYNGSVQGLWRI